ncbi:N-acetylated-alpha-linked acidic dipeptidase 2-like [Haliotis cracherodii]|uniref:N-acetylated-alpha-linked acidic dipeptidase 2-like n=1 Tax=Haliotis cracherodii TaxID=6455 RepID=UPI0039EA38DD
MKSVLRRWVLVVVLVGVSSFVIGALIGVYAPARSPTDEKLRQLIQEADPGVSQRLISGVNPSHIDTHLKELTQHPHLAGMPGNFRTAEYVRDQWLEQGYDVQMVPYDVLLSYPDDNHNNTASLTASDGRVLFQSTPREIAFFEEETHPEAVQPYNTFSPSGQPEAELVYVNYGRDVDFENLTRQGVNVSGKIVIARYGKVFRGNKVYFAHQYGAVGIILFMDPGDFAKGDNFYPESMWLPPTGVQRGNIVLIKGDQATPGYPATWYSARLNEQELKMKLPKIPCHPIGYSDAYMLLREMQGDRAPADWQGGLNITYRLGGTMKDGKRVRLDVRNHLKTVTIYNVLATMKGASEQDRVVLVGNHRDAYVYGGTDPSSGTAALLEMSRVYAQEVTNGWKPRRSIIFCSWDAEEFGVVGSYEWVEENVKWLQNQAVAYINIDLITIGNYTIAVSATPTLKQAIYRAARKVPDAHQEGRTLFDVWRERNPDPLDKAYPLVKLPGAGSDFLPFEQDVAIPTTDASYVFVDLGNSIFRGLYPLYHTLYDGYRFVKMIDPQLRVCRSLAALYIELARDLVDSHLLPFDVRDYATAIDGFVKNLFARNQDQFSQWNITSGAIQSAADNFTRASRDFHASLRNLDMTNPIAVRGVNDKLMTLEKAFQVHTGLPSRKEYKHVLLSPSSANYYKTTTFPGLADLLYQIGDNATRWREVKIHLSVLTFTIQSAAHILMS